MKGSVADSFFFVTFVRISSTSLRHRTNRKAETLFYYTPFTSRLTYSFAGYLRISLGLVN